MVSAETEVIARILARGFNAHIRDHGPDGDFADAPMEVDAGYDLIVIRGGVPYGVRVERRHVQSAPGLATTGDRTHWRMVPKALREAERAAFDSGFGAGWATHRAACAEAVEAVNDKLEARRG